MYCPECSRQAIQYLLGATKGTAESAALCMLRWISHESPVPPFNFPRPSLPAPARHDGMELLLCTGGSALLNLRGHVHREGCGHEKVAHDGHWDYLVRHGACRGGEQQPQSRRRSSAGRHQGRGGSWRRPPVAAAARHRPPPACPPCRWRMSCTTSATAAAARGAPRAPSWSATAACLQPSSGEHASGGVHACVTHRCHLCRQPSLPPCLLLTAAHCPAPGGVFPPSCPAGAPLM